MHTRKACTVLVLVAAIASTFSIPVSATRIRDPNTNLLLNGSFETGDFSEWEIGADVDYELPGVGRGGPRASILLR